MNEFEAKSVIDTINRMFKSRSFNICTVHDCMDVTGAVRMSTYKTLRLYHCVSYSEMDTDTKQMLFKATMENVCNVDEFPEIKMVKPSDDIQHRMELEHKERPLLKRLFGRI